MSFTLDQAYYIDGYSFWKVFGIAVEKGSEQFLEYATRKDSVTHDWLDQNGIEVDTSRVFFKERQVELKCSMIANSEADFHVKYDLFISVLSKPGLRRLEITELSKQFFVIYKETKNWQRFTRIKETNQVANKFSIILLETDPSTSLSQAIYLTDQAGRFIVT